MYDIMNQLLPASEGISRTNSRMLEQMKTLHASGIQSLCYAPYFVAMEPDTHGKAIRAAIKAHQDQGVLPLLPGHTLRLSYDLPEALRSGRALTLNDTMYVLIDIENKPITEVDIQLYELELAGYIPVILHPEKQTCFQNDTDKLYRLVKNGALAQIQAASLLGENGKKAKKLAQQFVKHKLAHTIASFEWPTDGGDCSLSKAVPLVEKIEHPYGDEVVKNLARIFNGEQIAMEEPVRVERSRFSSFFN
ncbi:CpsB/CapC family capsule biosynthesis tyrosine phosphatase [Shouchella tritolerans]|uniref:CpsB/CapC family capsule biosynthesis tyrosine phosphatase n=1 Tax=Shouchella tritolerans TaxID=2979466 RepID=UPI0021E97933|nr:CpsB/CapC family capsule biosynthesis tyrosine phosphatase [Shouchella tritolerans]